VTLRSMLAPYEPPLEPAAPDAVEQRLEQLCDAARQAWVAAETIADVRETSAETTLFDIALRAMADAAPTLPDGVACEVQAITRLHDRAAPVSGLRGEIASFTCLAVESLTSFFAVTVTARESGRSHSQRFVVNAPLVGTPQNRENKLLLAMLSNRERLIRYLRTRGTREVVGQVLSENRSMLDLAKSLGFRLRTLESEEIVEVRLSLQ